MTNVSSRDAIVLAYLARNADISQAEWEGLTKTLTGAARSLATQLRAKAEKTENIAGNADHEAEADHKELATK